MDYDINFGRSGPPLQLLSYNIDHHYHPDADTLAPKEAHTLSDGSSADGSQASMSMTTASSSASTSMMILDDGLLSGPLPPNAQIIEPAAMHGGTAACWFWWCL